MMNRNSAISMEDELKSFYEVFKGYRVLKDICDKSGIRLYNCTAGGLLDCVERKTYVINISSKKIHSPNCSFVPRTNEENKRTIKSRHL